MDQAEFIEVRKELDDHCTELLGTKKLEYAEENAVSNAARNGTNIKGSTLYMNCVIPCQKCFGTLINAGIVEIVVDSIEVYDQHTQFLIDNSNIKIREFSNGR